MKVTEAAATFGLSFFCFFYANISKFKRFKGLGFEAELWDEKQKEASQVVEELKRVFKMYSREMLIGKAMSGRWDSGGDWKRYGNSTGICRIIRS